MSTRAELAASGESIDVASELHHLIQNGIAPRQRAYLEIVYPAVVGLAAIRPHHPVYVYMPKRIKREWF